MDRRNQPRCQNTAEGGKACNHPRSFHGVRGSAELGQCKALGCQCEQWVAPDDETAEAEVVQA